MKRHFLTIIFLACFVSSFPQQKIYVVTKTISKEYQTTSKPEVKIKGEKSDISINSWKNKSVKIEIQLIARNPKKEKAEEDLKFINYNLDKSGESISMSNIFQSDKNAQITSNLSVKYNVWIPDNSIIKIENLYGDVIIENSFVQADIHNSFGQVNMKAITGKLNLNLYYADTRITNIQALVICNAVNSELSFVNASGAYEIASNYGNINFDAGENLKKLQVKSTRTEIGVEVGNFKKYSYNLVTQSSNLNLPGNYNSKIKKEARISRFEMNTNSSNPYIHIETTYCPIHINTPNQ